MDTPNLKRRKYVGIGGDDIPSLGVLEGDILRILWDAKAPNSSVEVYEAMFHMRRRENREMQSPSTIAVTLSRMVEKKLLTVERRPGGGKGYYYPAYTRAQLVAHMMDDVSRRLTGHTLGYVLHLLHNGQQQGEEDQSLAELVSELHLREQNLLETVS